MNISMPGSRAFTSLIAVIGLASATSVFAPVAALAAADIAAPGSGLTLGHGAPGWYIRENSGGKMFHWANNDVPIVIHNPQGTVKKIAIALEGGPGLANPLDFTVHLRTSDGKELGSVKVLGSAKVRFDVPTTPGRTETVLLHVDDGGKKIPKDVRTLNFRVFSIEEATDNTLAAGHPDITSPAVSLGDNWYTLEQSKGETFRWVDNDAAFNITGSKHKLEVTAASGPAIKNPGKWTLSLEDASGKVVATQQVKARSTVMFDLPSGSSAFKLHVDSTGTKSPNDPRTLSFRVFKLDAE